MGTITDKTKYETCHKIHTHLAGAMIKIVETSTEPAIIELARQAVNWHPSHEHTNEQTTTHKD